MSVNHSARPGGIKEISFRFSFTSKYVVCSLESPHRGDSNEYTQRTIINIKRKSLRFIPNTIMSAAMRFFVRDSRTISK